MCEQVLLFARETVGESVNAKTLDLRLWMAAMLIHTAFGVSIEAEIRESVEQKLKFLSRAVG